MKSPIDVTKGRIVDYDEHTGEVLIRAKYDDWYTMAKRGYRECLVQMIDSRRLSDKQRNACYAMLRAIKDWSGESMDQTKLLMKISFLENLQNTADVLFSLSDAPMSLVCAFQRYLAHFILDQDIPCEFGMLDMVDDIPDYIYHCLVTKKCCICGKHTDLHHVERVGMGRNRLEIIHEGMEVLPLCREHHTLAHTMPDEEFFDLFHIPGGIILDKSLCRLYGLKARK